MNTLKMAFLFLKKHWYLAIAALVFVAGWVLRGKDSASNNDLYGKIQARHDEVDKNILVAQIKKDSQVNDLIQQKNIKLEELEREKVQKLAEVKSDPDKLADALNKLTN